MAKKRFPTFKVIVLVIGIVWLLSEMGMINVRLPWLPVLIVIWALGAIINHYQK